MNAFLSILKNCVTKGYILSMIFICWQNLETLRFVHTYIMLIEYIDGVEVV